MILMAKKKTFIILYPGDVENIIVEINAKGEKSAFAKARVATGKSIYDNAIWHKVGSFHSPHPKIREYLKEHGLRDW